MFFHAKGLIVQGDCFPVGWGMLQRSGKVCWQLLDRIGLEPNFHVRVPCTVCTSHRIHFLEICLIVVCYYVCIDMWDLLISLHHKTSSEFRIKCTPNCQKLIRKVMLYGWRVECGSNRIIALVGERDSWVSYVVQRFGHGSSPNQLLSCSAFRTENSHVAVASFFGHQNALGVGGCY